MLNKCGSFLVMPSKHRTDHTKIHFIERIQVAQRPGRIKKDVG
jgi:hypothetical protein